MSDTCRDCGEGKHGACIGVALQIGPDDEITEVDCDCAAAEHEEVT